LIKINNNKDLIKGRLLFRNILWVGLSKIVPIVSAIIFIPILIKNFGDERFGLLSIVWVIIGLATVLDLGLGSAVVKFVSEKIGKNKENEIIGIFGLSWLIISILGIILSLILILLRKQIITSIFNIEPTLVAEADSALIYTALALPFVFSNSVFISILKAHQEFKLITIITSINSLFNYLVPLLVLMFTKDFSHVVLAIVLVKLIVFMAYMFNLIFDKGWLFGFKLNYLRGQWAPVLRFGGWVSISNLVSPILSYTDRFMVASIISVAAVTYYVTPMEMVVKVGSLAMPIVSVLFPAIANAQANNTEKLPTLLNTGLITIVLLSFPILYFLGLFSFEILELWVSPELAIKSSLVLKVLTVGILLRSMTYMPYSYLHGTNKPDVVAKIHLIELITYMILLSVGLKYWGIIGAATAFSIRSFIDYILLSIWADKNNDQTGIFTKYFPKAFILLTVFIVTININEPITKSIVYLFVVISFIWIMWRFNMNQDIRNFIKSLGANKT
tara:strand:- start:39309 stop:40817 length:1509 start_codon:yes stop_codon:yes gene_type:complete